MNDFREKLIGKINPMMKNVLWIFYICFISTSVISKNCSDKNFFGPSCQYMCHCTYSCDSNGNCIGPSEHCVNGWFGPGCQYQDLAASAIIKSENVVTQLLDNCSSSIVGQSLIFTWEDYKPFTWMRIKLLHERNLQNLSLTFTNKTQENIPCMNQRSFKLNKRTFDIYCDLKVAISQLIILGEFFNSICSVHISGGRNFALKQNTDQTSTYLVKLLYGSHKAVDGIVNASCQGSGCSHTAVGDRNPSWTVIFDKQYKINKFILYNRKDGYLLRLKHFNLEVLDNTYTTIFKYTDETNETKLNYTVMHLIDNLVFGVRVSQINIYYKEDKNPIVSLNEFEAFGECKPGMWGLNCENKCGRPCDNHCVQDDGSCNLVCIGHSDQTSCARDIEKSIVLVGTAIGGILLVLLTILGIIISRRKRNNRKGIIHNERKTSSEVQLIGLNMITRAETEDSIAAVDNEDTSITNGDLLSFMQSKNTDFFKQQFQSMPEPQNVTTYAARRHENRTKNRFKNVSPYDHSRVHLIINTESHGSDYINASYIKDYNDGVKFIASQGPSSFTVKDFVRMLWEQNTEVIVMLTKIIEDGKEKCQQYWSDSDVITIGDIKIIHISTQTFADYTIRKLELSKKGEYSHHLTQFHFTSWPDKSVPTSAWSLVDFQNRVFCVHTSRPIVVHCSAGVGRTGTFIALHNVMMQAEKEKKVDFYNTVLKLRQDRMLMVPTAQQYELLHQAALTAIVFLDTTIQAVEFDEKLADMETNYFYNNSKMHAEFKDICDVCKVYEISLNNQKVTEKTIYQNAAALFKDRYPADCYRPQLACASKDVGGYNNAVVLSCLRQKHQLIVTHLPTSHAIADFWSLVTQYHISLIVAFEVDDMKRDKTLGKYLPSSIDSVLICPPFQIKCVHSTGGKLWQKVQLSINSEKSSFSSDHENYKLNHIKCKFTELNCIKMLSFITEIRQKQSADGRVLYMCRNGAQYSGLACVLALLLDRMDNDSFINIPLVVGTVKSIRPQVIPTVEQYRFIYKMVQLYNQNRNAYSKRRSQTGVKALTSVRSDDYGEKHYANL